MKRMVFVAILGIVMTSGLCADTPPTGVTSAPGIVGPPPFPLLQLLATMARLNKKGQVVLKFKVTRSVPVTATHVLRDGKEVKEKHTFYEWVTYWEDQTYDPKDIKLLDSNGKPLDKKVLPELLKKERLVLLLYGDDKIDSALLKVIKEGTPILVLPPYQGPN
jgi:hypothetical protein